MCVTDYHIFFLILIMILVGSFGGYLNYLHSFDINDDKKMNNTKWKYILLGIGAAFLVPLFLKMIASNLINYSNQYDSCNYLIFIGFCLVAAIFSRKFITTIGDKILETAKRAERISNKNNQEIQSAKQEIITTKESVEDVKLMVDLENSNNDNYKGLDNYPLERLIKLVNSYIEKTSIPDYTERLKLKAELGRKMAQIIILNSLNKTELLTNYNNEGMFLALACTVQLKPDKDGLFLLNKLSNKTKQLYTKYSILVGYRTLARKGLIDKESKEEILIIINSFRLGADAALCRNIEDTINVIDIYHSN